MGAFEVAGATAAYNLYPQAGIWFRLFVQDLLNLIFSFLGKSDRHSLNPPELNSHDLKSNRSLVESSVHAADRCGEILCLQCLHNLRDADACRLQRLWAKLNCHLTLHFADEPHL